METNERKEHVEQPEAVNNEMNVTPLFDEDGNLLEHEEVKNEVDSETTNAGTPAHSSVESEIAEAELVTEVPEETTTAPEAEVVAEVPEETTTAPEAEVVAEVQEETTTAPEAEVVAEVPEDTTTAPEAEVVAEVPEETTTAPEAEVVAEVPEDVTTAPEAEVVAQEKQSPVVAAEETEESTKEPAANDNTEEDGDGNDDDEVEDHVDYSAFTKEELVVALEELVSGDDTMLHRQKAGKLRLAFIELVKSQKESALSVFISNGGNEIDFQWIPDEMQIRFTEALATYKQKKQQFLERQEEIKKENLTKKLEMLDQIKELINSEEPLKKTYDEFKGIQDKWREIGNVPKSEIGNLWQSYHFLVEKFFDKVKINNELRDLDMKKNMERKIELCEKAEELLLESSVLQSFKQLQRYHAEWKDIGLVPHDKKDELWERFRTTTEKINERRQEYYEKLHQEQENNYGVKRALCEKIEELLAVLPSTVKEWQSATDEINELMKMWRSIGPAPRQHNDEIWKRFKGHVDGFFTQKKEHFNAVKDEQVNNYNLKLDICQQAEAMQESTDWRETTEELIRLQQDWKRIGPVPRRHSDKIWKRFRGACDAFFERKQAHFSKQKASEEENLAIKEGLIEQIKQIEVVNGNREDALEKLKEIQRTFIETGHVPFRKKNDVNGYFREAINQKLDQLKINYAEISTGMPRPRRDNREMRPQRGGDNRMERGPDREHSMIMNKITKMKSDIALWENNIGFLANSAAAEVLKQEFDKKIQSTKDEITLLEAKMKVMQQESDSKE